MATASATLATIAELLNPRSVALVGASEDQTKFGGRLYRMLLKHEFGGAIYPISPKHESLFGVKTYASITATPEVPDMVVIALPQPKVKAAIEAAATRGIRSGIIITAQFSDAGPEGEKLESEIVTIANAHGMRLIGPNCLGLLSPVNKVVLCCSSVLDVDYIPVGQVGIASQSGALMMTVIDRAFDMGVSFSHCVSVGNQADVELCDIVEFMIDDEHTRIICTYIEGIKDPARFVALAKRARAAGKPWLTLKAGRSEAGSKAAFSHTASLSGSHAVFESVCREENISLHDDIGSMILLATALVRHPSALVRDIAIVSPSGAAVALACDALADRQLSMAHFSQATRQRLAAFYSGDQTENPIDLYGRKFDGAVDVEEITVRTVAADANTDALLLPITAAPILKNLSESIVRGLITAGNDGTKPALCVVQPSRAADGAREVFRNAGILFTNHQSEAIDVLAAWTLRGQYKERTEADRPTMCPDDRIGTFSGDLDEATSKAFLSHYAIPVNDSRTVMNAQDAASAADGMGYPVVMKIVSIDIPHKTDVGGVEVDLADRSAVVAAYARIVSNANRVVPYARIDGLSVQPMSKGKLELIVGARRDPQFGAIIVFGAGGTLVEILPARVISRAPLAAIDAQRLLQSLPVWPILSGYRGAALNVDAVVDTIVRVSWVAHDLRETDFELDINPLIVGERDCCAVDARLRIVR